MIACGDGQVNADATSGLALHAAATPLADFKYDTGLLPAGSPAQVQLKLSAGGGLTVDVAADGSEKGLVGKPGGGKLAIDLHVKLEGRLKVDSAFKSYDGELPGLKDIDIPIAGSAPFDGFLLGNGENTTATAELPETTLPEIPLGSVPGSLVLTVVKGSALTSSFHGSCLSVAGGQATYTGESKTSGTLILKGKIVLKLPAPLNKSVDLPEIKVAIPEVTTKVEGASPVAGIADAKQGACGAAPAASDPPAAASSGKPAGSGGTGGASASPDGGAAACNVVKNVAAFVPFEQTSGTAPVATGGAIKDGTYALLSMRAYTSEPLGDLGTTKHTVVVSGGRRLEGVTEDGETHAVDTVSGVFTTQGTTISRTYSCPAAVPSDSATYSATTSSFTRYVVQGGITIAYTYGKQ